MSTERSVYTGDCEVGVHLATDMNGGNKRLREYEIVVENFIVQTAVCMEKGGESPFSFDSIEEVNSKKHCPYMSSLKDNPGCTRLKNFK